MIKKLINKLFKPKAVAKPEDMAGLKIRVPESPVWVEMIRAMAGRIEVRSAPGQGSVFRVLLPTSAPETPETPRFVWLSSGTFIFIFFSDFYSEGTQPKEINL